MTDDFDKLAAVDGSVHGYTPAQRVILLSVAAFVSLQIASLVVLSDWPNPYVVCGQRFWRGGFPFIAFVHSYGGIWEWHFSPVMLAVNAMVCLGLPAIFLTLHRRATKQPINFSLRTALAATTLIASLLALAVLFDDLSREAINEWWWHLPLLY